MKFDDVLENNKSLVLNSNVEFEIQKSCIKFEMSCCKYESLVLNSNVEFEIQKSCTKFEMSCCKYKSLVLNWKCRVANTKVLY